MTTNKRQNLTANKKSKQPPSKEPISPELILKAIEGSRGILSLVARRCAVSRTTIYNALEAHPELKTALEEARETLNDDVELTIADDMLGGWVENPDKPGEKFYRSPNAVLLMFWAKTQMRHRGFVEKLQIDINPQAAALLPELQKAADAAGVPLLDVFKELIVSFAEEKAET